MRLIDADALFAEFENVGWYNNADRDEIAEPLILQAPTIDAVEVVHGKWRRKMVDDGFNIDWICSKCGYRVMTDFVSYSYCPNCGARMKGADDEKPL